MKWLAFLSALALVACSDATSQDPVLTTIEVSPNQLSFTTTGEGAQLTAVARDQFGNVMSGITFTWESDLPDVATVDSNGMVRAGTESCLATVLARANDGIGRTVVSSGVFVEVTL